MIDVIRTRLPGNVIFRAFPLEERPCYRSSRALLSPAWLMPDRSSEINPRNQIGSPAKETRVA
jgi:hypothetical protein